LLGVGGGFGSRVGGGSVDVMPGLADEGNDFGGSIRNNLMLHFTPLADTGPNIPVIVSGEGCYVKDDRGKTYIDGLGALFTTQIGHGRRELAGAAARQIEELAYYPAWSFMHPRCMELSERLAGLAPGELGVSFFVNSGSEAVEAAMKLARQYHRARGEPGRYKFVSRDVAYHGTTFGALSVNGVAAFREPFEPLVPGCLHVPNTAQDPEGAADAIAEAVEREGPETVAAVFLEPVQNAGGCLVPPEGYWQRVREVCDEHGVLLVADEVICGFGRIGEWFGVERFGVVPDMVTFAKGVTSAYAPMGGVIARPEIREAIASEMPMFFHGSTFGGHPVSAALALENIRIIEEEGLIGNVRDLEGFFGEELSRVAESHPTVKDVRGMGFFWALELKPERADGTPLEEDEYQKYFKGVLSRGLFERGLICRFDDKADPVIQYSPPLVADREIIGKIAEITDHALTDLERALGYRA
jgi:adenosylmethionine-8-amino-7-oxononanoate aminotransferase